MKLKFYKSSAQRNPSFVIEVEECRLAGYLYVTEAYGEKEKNIASYDHLNGFWIMNNPKGEKIAINRIDITE